MRWSAGRAVAYSDVFGGLWGYLSGIGDGAGDGDGDGGKGRRKVVCFGGGAGAEVVGLAFGFAGNEEEEWDIVVVDLAPWGSVLGKLETAMKASSSLVTSDSDSDFTGTANSPDPAKKCNVTFQRRDILDLSSQDLRDLCQDTKMVTLMFTLNELYGISIAKTTGMLLDLTGCVERGCLLVVVDSPGSYSTLALNNNHDKRSSRSEDGEAEGVDGAGMGIEKEKEKQKEVKKYPMKWLLDHTLLEVASAAGARGGEEGTKSDAEGGKRWEKIHSEDSRWCRLRGEELRYPIALEDMRMQVHVYRRL